MPEKKAVDFSSLLETVKRVSTDKPSSDDFLVDVKLIRAIFNNEYCGRVLPELHPEDFELQEAREIFQIIRRVYRKHNTIPSAEEILLALSTERDEEFCRRARTFLERCAQEQIGELTLEALEQLVYRRRVIALQRRLAKAAYDFDPRYVEQLPKPRELKPNFRERSYHEFTDVEVRHQVFESKAFHGFPTLDRVTNGIGAGELVLMIGRKGVGKSWIACKIALENFLRGKKVVLFTLEMSEASFLGRMDTLMFGKPLYDILLEDIPPELTSDRQKLFAASRKLLETICEVTGGRLFVFRFPSAGLSASQISKILDDLSKDVGPIDLVIVDYIDNMRHEGGAEQKKRMQLSETTIQLRGVAERHKVAMIAFKQADKRALSERFVGTEHSAESWSATWSADMVIGISRLRSEPHRMTVHLSDSRRSVDGIVFTVDFDPTHGIIRESYVEAGPPST